MIQPLSPFQPVQTAIEITPGCLLNQRYQVEQLLGCGGFSQTYRVLDLHKPSHPACVVKHLKPASSDPSYLQTAKLLFLTEAESLEQLGNHSQIPTLFAYFEEQQNFFLVQEYIEGHLLSTELQPGRLWMESEVVILLHDVLSILEFVHHQGIIHRDIKPDNLIRRFCDRQLVLIDFGSVKQLRTQTASGQAHRNATIAIGTKGYIAPEQGQGNPCLRSDLYSLGMIAIQALTGLEPTQFEHHSDTGDVCWQGQVNISRELADIVDQLTAFHFKDRYSSTTEALAAIKTLIDRPLSSPIAAQTTTVTTLRPSSTSASTVFSTPVATTPTISPQTATIVTPPDVSMPASFLTPSTIQSTSASQSFSQTYGNSASTQNKTWVKYGLGTGIAATTLLTIGIYTMPNNTTSSPTKANTPENTAGQTSANRVKQDKLKSAANDMQHAVTSRPQPTPLPSMLPTMVPNRTTVPSTPPPVTVAKPVAQPSIAAVPHPTGVTQPEKREPLQQVTSISQVAPVRQEAPVNQPSVQEPALEQSESEVQFEIYEQVRIPLLTEQEQMEKFTAALEASPISDIAIALDSESTPLPEDTKIVVENSNSMASRQLSDETVETTHDGDQELTRNAEVPTLSTAHTTVQTSSPDEMTVTDAMPEVVTDTIEDSSSQELDKLEPSIAAEVALYQSEVPSQEASYQPEIVEQPEVQPSTAAISPDGYYLAGASSGNGIKVWNVQTGELLYSIQVEATPVQSVSFSNDSHVLATIDSNGITKYWDLQTGNSMPVYNEVSY